MSVKNFIEKEIETHIIYRGSIKPARGISNEFYHPKTNKRISFNQYCSLIDNDLKKRVNNILNKINK